MTDWFDPGAWESVARTAAAIVEALAKLRNVLQRKATRPEDARALDEELDAMQATLQQLIDLMMQHVSSNGKVWEAVVKLLGPLDAPEGERGVDRVMPYITLLLTGVRVTSQLQDVVLAHERRLQALEHPSEDDAATRPKRKRRK
jgi:hypothetical protein